MGGLARRRRRPHQRVDAGHVAVGRRHFEGQVGWSGELGYGVRAPEPAQDVRDASTRDKTVRSVER